MILFKAFKHEDIFEDKFGSSLADLFKFYQDVKKCKDKISGSEEIFYLGFREFIRLRKSNSNSPEFIMQSTKRSMRIVLSKRINELSTDLGFLATIASISPYIGLFGTVYGIMNTFISLGGGTNHASLTMMAPGIAEALVATGIGLFTAIPAMMAYNYFSTQVSKLENSYNIFLEEFYSILYRLVMLAQEQ
ncbi:protein tolQ [Candidatus Photodesmus katoptron]|nr:protein tolQ [Candidatus Photodesmus katoptron]